MFRGALWVCFSLLVSTHAWAEEGVESLALLASASTSEAGLAHEVTFVAEETVSQAPAAKPMLSSRFVRFSEDEGLVIVGGASHLQDLR